MQTDSHGRVMVYILRLEKNLDFPAIETTLKSFLPESRVSRYTSYSHPSNRLQSIAGEVLSRFAIQKFTGTANKDIEIGYGENGKPFITNLENVHFNISHSGDFVVCAVSNNEVGIDVERIRKVNLRIAERYFSASELYDLMQLGEEERKTYFITLWTVKESYLKAIGKGLTQHLNSFTVTKSETGYQLIGNSNAESYHIEIQQISNEYMLACCMAEQKSSLLIKEISIEEIISSLPFHRNIH